MTGELEGVAEGLLAGGKGILAFDETPGPPTRRFTEQMEQAA
jgi:hypothetical protein